MGQPVSEGTSSNPKEEPEELFEGERALTRDFTCILQASIETYVRREATAEDVPESAVWSALGVSPMVNRLMNNLPSLLAQAFLALQTCREETYCKNHRQHILQQFEERSRHEEEECDESRRRTFNPTEQRN